MPKAEVLGDVIVIQTTYQDRHLMAQLPGARYQRAGGHWTAPLSWATCVTARGLFGTQLEVGEQLQAWAWSERKRRIEPALRMRAALTPDNTEYTSYLMEHLDLIEENASYRLYPYQRVDAAFLATNRRALLANPPGLGKTGASIRAVQLLSILGEATYPMVVVCPNSLKFTVWRDDLRKWAPDLNVVVVDGSAGKRRKQLAQPADVYVVNWDGLRLHSRLAGYGQIALTDAEHAPKELNELGLKTAIFDEAHRLKDPRAKQTRAAWAVAHEVDNCLLLTGTPAGDHIGDAWGLLHALEKTWFPGKTRFMDRYAQVSLNFYGGAEVLGIKPETREEFFAIIDPLMRRVPKKAALPQLPPMLPVQYRHTPMSPKQQKAYNQMRDEMVAQLNALLVAPDPLSKLTRLMQFASSSAEINEDGEVRLTSPSSKVDDLADLLEEMGDEPLVVAAVSRQLIYLAAKRLDQLKISYGLVTGAQSSLERQQAVNRFQEGHDRVILLTLGAGAEGITLTRADTMLFMQEDWSEIRNQQARDRVHRIGSEIHEFVRIIVQLTPDSVEENKQRVIAGKQVRMEEIVRDEQMLLRLLGAG